MYSNKTNVRGDGTFFVADCLMMILSDTFPNKVEFLYPRRNITGKIPKLSAKRSFRYKPRTIVLLCCERREIHPLDWQRNMSASEKPSKSDVENDRDGVYISNVCSKEDTVTEQTHILQARVRSLKAAFLELGSPTPPEDISSLANRAAEKFPSVKKISIPIELREIWMAASEWHLSHNHCDCFGFNIFSPNEVVQVTAEIFGNDEELLKQWRKDTASAGKETSCAHEGWLCLASTSEYDFIFVNVDAESPFFGRTRHVVNNCCEDEDLTSGPFDEFLTRVENLIERVRHALSAQCQLQAQQSEVALWTEYEQSMRSSDADTDTDTLHDDFMEVLDAEIWHFYQNSQYGKKQKR
ncbi:hypothetical protein CYMTET_47036 [Cymbomonas tetramitiformis]|uniref:Uncharacterized protein n=1 Tax=Cymbomonas tetramitiformis TaxID=36881 RepID=A0AAE0BV11_9CHLO|nr:hypothetical protein CYMTET_47036 [Cymbomonas tetramitiformis]